MEGFFKEDRTPFDIHFYFDDKTIESALKIRKDMSREFNGFKFYEPQFEKVGPHPLPMWEAHFSKAYNKNSPDELGRAIIWLMKNRKQHSVLIHPNTNDALKDHSVNAIWLGEKLNLNLDIIRVYLNKMKIQS